MKPRLVVMDLDNTLYDWFHMWHQSFRALLDQIVAISGIPEEALIPSIRQVYQRHGTSEYAFLIEELDELRGAMSTDELLRKYQPAIEAHRTARTESLTLYPGVLETIETLRARGTRVVAYTDSLAFYVAQRIRVLGLDGLIEVLYSPPDHATPADLHLRRSKPDEAYELKETLHHHLDKGLTKPNPDVLRGILKEQRTDPSEALYVGDSITKDILMAQSAEVGDAWAKYGKVQHQPGYELLRAVSHWTDEDVEREKQLSDKDIIPSRVLESFAELLD